MPENNGPISRIKILTLRQTIMDMPESHKSELFIFSLPKTEIHLYLWPGQMFLQCQNFPFHLIRSHHLKIHIHIFINNKNKLGDKPNRDQ